MLLREGKDASEYTLERTYKSLVQPSPDRGPYLSQEADCFFLDEPPEPGQPIRGWT